MESELKILVAHVNDFHEQENISFDLKLFLFFCMCVYWGNYISSKEENYEFNYSNILFIDIQFILF